MKSKLTPEQLEANAEIHKLLDLDNHPISDERVNELRALWANIEDDSVPLEQLITSPEDFAADHSLSEAYGLFSQDEAIAYWKNIMEVASANLEYWAKAPLAECEKAVKDFIENYDPDLDF